MPPKPVVKSIVKKGLPTVAAKLAAKPAKSAPTKPVSKELTKAFKSIEALPKSQTLRSVTTGTSRTIPLKTGVERPVLRAFECLVKVEQAQAAMKSVGIFVGSDAEKQRALQEQITQDLIQLHLSYKTYWKTVDIESVSKAEGIKGGD